MSDTRFRGRIEAAIVAGILDSAARAPGGYAETRTVTCAHCDEQEVVIRADGELAVSKIADAVLAVITDHLGPDF